MLNYRMEETETMKSINHLCLSSERQWCQMMEKGRQNVRLDYAEVKKVHSLFNKNIFIRVSRLEII